MYACYCIYNEEYFLKQSLQSIAPYVEKIIIIDGAWATFAESDFASTDASKQIAKEVCGKKLIWVDAPEDGWKSQIEKRNKYIELVPDGEWFIVFDADETIHGNVKAEFKILEASDLNYCLLPTRLHAPYVKTLDYTKANGFGGYADVNNPYSATFLKVFDTEEKFNNMSWISFISHRYALYKKEPDMHYSNHHSQIFIGNTLIFNKYPKQRNNINDKLVLNDLKYLRPYKRWKQNMEDRAKRLDEGINKPVIEETPQWKLNIEKYKRTTPLDRNAVKPLMIIRSPRENEFIKKNFELINTVDQLWIKHYPILEANKQLLSWVKEHKDEYTHVVFTTDDVIFSKQDFEQLMYDVCQYDFPIISGICNFCTTWLSSKKRCDACEENFEHEHLSVTFTPLRDALYGGYLHDKNPRTPYLSRATYDFVPTEWSKKNQIIRPVYFQGIALTAIRMDVFLEMDGLHVFDKEHGLICADDADLAIYCHNHGIEQMGDFRIIIRHYGRKDIYTSNMNTKSGSRVILLPKTVSPEPFKDQQRLTSGEEDLKAEYEKLCERLVKENITIPLRPSGEGVYVFDNACNRSLNQADWDARYGKYAKFIK